MKKIGMVKALRLCKQYDKMGPAEREAMQSARLSELVRWAREESPIYQERYRHVPASFRLEDLPPVDKSFLMEHFDEWLVDRSVKLANVERFMADTDNIGRRFAGEYLVFTTSGSTGNPMVALCDKSTNNVMGAINAMRSFARKEDMKAFVLRGGKSIGVFATGGFYLGNSSVRARQLQMPWKKRQMAITSALLPVAQIVDELNHFQPAMLGGYPSNLELLVDEQKSGRLRISPVLVMTGGEYLAPGLRQKLAAAFNCTVQTSYACTEGGTIACECPHQHLHLNDDWVLVEPVDQNNKPVPAGSLADKILLTNLYNYTQPFIRYEVTDRVILHPEACPCGNPSPWLEIEGRNDDVVTFSGKDGEVKIPPLAIYAALKEVHSLKRFQLLVSPNNVAAIRLQPQRGADTAACFSEAKQAFLKLAAQHRVEQIRVIYDETVPSPQPGSGKYKHIIHLTQNN